MGDSTRRDIVRRAIDGEEGVAELAVHYPMSFAAVRKHVAILERARSRQQASRRAADGRPHQDRRRTQVDAHDLRPGGHVEYHMTGPEGDQPRGFWDVDEVEPP
jgi:hypothetical protein